MISMQDISFSYRSKQLFSQLDLFLPDGGICGLLGKNGAGKTSLLKLMSGLLFPQKGALVVGDETPSRRSPEFLEDLFFIPEEFRFPPVTPEKYMWLYAPFYPGFDPAMYRGFLEQFEVDRRLNLHQSSYGQRKKCLIAFGLASNCRLILLDEPTNGLDIPSKRQFRRLLASVLTEARLFVIATHQVRDLESLIDPVVILDNGKIIFNHSLEEISKHLRVEIMQTLPETDAVLYSEKNIGGIKAVLADSGQADGFIDLETLFNTVIENPDQVASVFEKEGHHAD
jgi:ABC-2 type transport system ATP-binding protein